MALPPGLIIKDYLLGDRVAVDLHGNKELKFANENWKTFLNEENVRYLKIVPAYHSKIFGIQQPNVEYFSKITATEGAHFDSSKDTIFINSAASSLGEFSDAVELITHENTHNRQFSLVKQLEKGSIKKGDADYEAAVLSAEDLNGVGYVTQQQSQEGYRAQPAEHHAYGEGISIAQKVISGL